jgi:hypothetical protein
LSDYNAGILHGVWIDAVEDADELQEPIDRMLAASPTTRRYGDVAEEWAIHDFEGFGNLRNRTLEHCTHDWTFSLDSDERCTREVRDVCGLVEEHRVMDGFEIQWEQGWQQVAPMYPGRPVFDVCSRACLEGLYAKRVDRAFPGPKPVEEVA